MSDKIFRYLVCVLLTCMLAVQLYSVINTMQNKPVTYGDLRNAKQADEKKQLLMKVPIVHAQISDTISVEINNEPLRVNIE
jgi:hypothetical protein